MKNKLLFGSLALFSAVALVGCGNEDKGAVSVELVTSIENPVEIEYWHSMSGAFSETIDKIVEDFNETIGEEQGVHVKATYQGGYSDLKAKTVAAIKAGNSPAVIQGTVNNIMEYTQSGYVQDLTPYITNEVVGIKDFEDIYSVYREESSSYLEDGGYYSLPFAKSTDLLFYNETLFTENNLEVPTTWEELVEVSEQITALTGKPALSIDNLPNYLITYLHQNNAGYTTKDGELLFNNPTSLEAINLIKTNIDNGVWRIAGEDGYSSAPFLAENTYMYIGSSAGEGFLTNDNFNWAATTVPQSDLENPTYIQQGSNVAVLNQGKTSEEVLGAYLFVKYLSSYEANLTWCMNTGYLPIRGSVANSEEYLNFISESNSTTKPNAIKSVENGFVEALFTTGSITSDIVRNEVGVMLEDIILGNLDPQTALDHYTEKLNNY